MPSNPSITGLFPDELNETLRLSPPYRGLQVFRAVYSSGVEAIDEMTTLPKMLREAIATSFTVYSSQIDEQYADRDGTKKIIIRLSDGLRIEAVLLEDMNFRKTACISTQVGCGMGCVFCKTGTLGLKRNLTAGEITEQFLLLRGLYGQIANIVVMGMGEPAANLKEVRKALRILHHPKGCNIGYRKMTISTCGIGGTIRDLAENGPPVRLAVSLGSAREDVRRRLMPGAGRTSPEELREELISSMHETGKRITVEYVLIEGTNDTPEDVKALKEFVRPLHSIVNIIPLNTVPSLPYKPPNAAVIEGFIDSLEKSGIKTTRRYRRGREIGGACGLLGHQDGPNSSNAG